MPHFIKTGYWEKAVKTYKGWLDLEQLIGNTAVINSGGAISLGAGTSFPNGQVYGRFFNYTLSNVLYFDDGDAWIPLGGGGGGSYLKYIASLNQAGTSDPTVIVHENTIGDIVWTRDGVGHYSATLIGAFPVGKVWCSAQSGSMYGNTTITVGFARETDNNLLLRTGYINSSGIEVDVDINCDISVGVPSYEYSIEIRVYP